LSGNGAEGSKIDEGTSSITIELVGASRRVDDECEHKKNEVADFGKPNKRPEGSRFSPNVEVEINVTHSVHFLTRDILNNTFTR